MDTPRYRFDFSSVTDGWSTVRRTQENSDQAIQFQAGISDASFAYLPYGRLPDFVADMIDLALAVYITDRFSPRLTDVPYHLEIHLPIRSIDHYQQRAVLDALGNLLYFMTRDHWTFIFTPRVGVGRASARQSPVIVTDADQPEVALWSGGLDALAGLYHRFNDISPDRPFTLFGTGGNTFIHKIQKDLYHQLGVSLVNSPHSHRKMRFVQVPLRVQGTKSLPTNKHGRARGFIFLLLGTACALLEQQSTLHVYENGIGAINLRYSRSEVGMDHSRAVHPQTIRQMKRLVALLIDREFSYSNPFEWDTKAQVCERFLTDRMHPLLAICITCDSRYRAIPMQCGRCTSCLLRRQALAVGGYREPPKRYMTTAQPEKVRADHGTHLRAMLYQADTIRHCVTTADPWIALTSTYPELADIADEVMFEDRLPELLVHSRIIRLYDRYSTEWEQVASHIGQYLLDVPPFPGEQVAAHVKQYPLDMLPLPIA